LFTHLLGRVGQRGNLYVTRRVTSTPFKLNSYHHVRDVDSASIVLRFEYASLIHFAPRVRLCVALTILPPFRTQTAALFRLGLFTTSASFLSLFYLYHGAQSTLFKCPYYNTISDPEVLFLLSLRFLSQFVYYARPRHQFLFQNFHCGPLLYVRFEYSLLSSLLSCGFGGVTRGQSTEQKGRIKAQR
jgi:hypothetical protein